MAMRSPGQAEKIITEKFILAIVLPAVAGAVNASGFLALGTYTSHVTGHVARIGDELAQGHSDIAWAELGFVAAFLGGVMMTTSLIEIAKVRSRARHALPLILQAAVLAVFSTWAAWRGNATASRHMISLLCFAMGLQNALVTRASGAVVRTTHLTGLVTDVGIELTRLAFWTGARVRRSMTHQSFRVSVRTLLRGGEWRALRMHLSVLASFFSGALLGPELFLRVGQIAMIGPCVVLLLLALFDIFFGIHNRPQDMRPAERNRQGSDSPA